MEKIVENKIIHVGTTYNKEKSTTIEHYTYNFSMIGSKLNEDDGTTYGANVNLHAEVVQLIREQFYWNLIKFAYNLDMDKNEDFLFFMQKIYPENFENMSLEEFKKLDITDLK